MIEIKVSPEMVELARQKSDEMGKLNNGITQGEGNTVGFIGELIAQKVLGGVISNTYDYDLIMDNGNTVDVKTKKTTAIPRLDYDCYVAAYNTKQQCQFYCFVRVLNDLSKGWFLGVYSKEDYYRDSHKLKKGDLDPSNNYIVKADCYNLKISNLKDQWEAYFSN